MLKTENGNLRALQDSDEKVRRGENMEEKDKLIELCELVANEKDHQKLKSLLLEIGTLLDAKDQCTKKEQCIREDESLHPQD